MHTAIRVLTIFGLTVAACMFSAVDALAWGPGVHMAAGNFFLNNTGLLPSLIAQLISANPNAFLYGCLSADIFIGKGTVTHPAHSHNWLTGFKLLEQADSPEIKAYAWGYLTHLAADTVAHNYYVPNMLGHMPTTGTMSHVSVEMLADAKMDWDPRQAESLFKRSMREQDGSIISVTDHRKMLFRLKKRIMRSSISICRRKGWDSSLDLASRVLHRQTHERFLREMYSLSLNAVADFLNDPYSSAVLSLDPVGTRNLRRIRRLRYTEGGKRLRLTPAGTLFPVRPAILNLPRVEDVALGLDLQARCG